MRLTQLSYREYWLTPCLVWAFWVDPLERSARGAWEVGWEGSDKLDCTEIMPLWFLGFLLALVPGIPQGLLGFPEDPGNFQVRCGPQ